MASPCHSASKRMKKAMRRSQDPSAGLGLSTRWPCADTLIAFAIEILLFMGTELTAEYGHDLCRQIHQGVILQHARSWQIDAELAHNTARPGRKNEHAITKCHC